MIRNILGSVLDKFGLKAKKVKLHVGCGTLYKDGWINIDNNSDNNIHQLDINHDLSTGLPFEDKSVDIIYHEHFIEHLTYDDGCKFLSECYRVLKDGGVMRVACPDLDDLVTSYVNDTWKEQEWVEKYGCQWIKNKCHMLNICMRYWGHKFIYNKDEMIDSLIFAGFNRLGISSVKFGESSWVELRGVDTRQDSMFLEVKK